MNVKKQLSYIFVNIMFKVLLITFKIIDMQHILSFAVLNSIFYIAMSSILTKCSDIIYPEDDIINKY